MTRKYLLGVVAVLVLLLAVWLVPMAIAAGSGGQTTPDRTQSQAPSGSQCPFLQAHPWMDPHGSGDSGAGATGTSQEIVYY
jgi:hypothetical protein